MDFFTSVFTADPDPPNPHPEDKIADSEHQPQVDNPDLQSDDAPPSTTTTRTAAWGFGGLIKTLASRSESVLQTYRRDLEEFGSGLKKESATIREVATRVVRDLPTSLEAGASAAQESLENVGQAIDDLGGTVWRGTADIISQGKDVLLAIDSDTEGAAPTDPLNPGSAKRYSRFEVQVMGIQGDQTTFLEDPEDKEDFDRWNEGFQLSDDEIDELCAENVVLQGMFEKLVPRAVDYDTFWTRYLYKVFKLKQVEDARAKLVKRVIAREEDEEDLSWEVDDDDEEEERGGGRQKVVVAAVDEGERTKKDENKVSDSTREITEATTKTTREIKPLKEEEKAIENVSQIETVVEEKPVISLRQVESVEKAVPPPESNVDEDPKMTKSDDKTVQDGKAEPVGSCKDSDISVVSSQPSMQEEDDLGWDEIEDLGENDEKKPVGSSAGSNKVDLRKRLSVADDDEDLSWDIEDD